MAAAAKSLSVVSNSVQPIDGSPPGSPVPGILQARILDSVAQAAKQGITAKRSQMQS